MGLYGGYIGLYRRGHRGLYRGYLGMMEKNGNYYLVFSLDSMFCQSVAR